MFNGRCRGSDTFSRQWNFVARWYNWRATAQPLRTDVSRAKESMSTGGKVTLRPHLIEAGGSSEAWYGGEGGYLKSRSQFRLALPRRGPAPSWAPHAGDTSPASPLFKSRPLHSRCRASDTFLRLWKYMARRYYWRATAQPLRTDVSRAKFGGEGGI